MKYVPGDYVDKPCVLNYNMELILPSEKLRNIKFNCERSLLVQRETGGIINLHGHSTLTYNDDKSIKIEGAMKSSGIRDWDYAHESDMKLTLSILKLPPITCEDSFKYEPGENKARIIRKTSIKYDQKDLTLSIDPLTFNRDLSYIELKAKANTPYKTLHQVDLDLKHEVSFSQHC